MLISFFHQRFSLSFKLLNVLITMIGVAFELLNVLIALLRRWREHLESGGVAALPLGVSV